MDAAREDVVAVLKAVALQLHNIISPTSTRCTMLKFLWKIVRNVPDHCRVQFRYV